VDLRVGKEIETQVISKIAVKFAQMEADLDVIFNIFLDPNQGPDQRNEIRVQRFKEVLISELRVENLKPQDIDMLVKSSQILQGKQKISRTNFKHMFEFAVKQASIRTMDSRAQFNKSYAEAKDFFRQSQMMG
jgi:hypothetical protein